MHPIWLFLGVIIDFMFFAQLWLIFMAFLLNIFDSAFALGKCFPILGFFSKKNNFPMLVFTLKEKGGLNYIIFFLLFPFSSFRVCPSLFLFLYFNSSLRLLLRSACLYVVFALSKISWLHEISAIGLLIALGSSFKIFGGWFKCLLM